MPGTHRITSSLTLKHLHHISCPVCTAGVRGVEITGQHTNGEQFESVKFLCGSSIKYVPNFSQEKVDSTCPNAHTIALKLIQVYGRLLMSRRRSVPWNGLLAWLNVRSPIGPTMLT